ncbi:alpha/beta fold hydrolase [Flaviaesturariibacter aridisoli]|uniref:Alpha/beta hydrolase n=1 Tax=Flaviaesturariibacter aridisoli TaxID=2545761 RepID=A0A4V2WMC2_9BACT|nr:alpha/beta hydrolase [Flaviaesturariibacter aridisoli]TCZ67189.1 alpha/beta hydrolase [Flaviaesturariibacter aridisoli]
MKSFWIFLFACCLAAGLKAQSPLTYPYPVSYLALTIEQQRVKMAFMDVRPEAQSNGRTVVLLHGKNFNGFYWKDVIHYLSGAGYRVLVPDQVGWGASDKPAIQYSFHRLAANTKALLDSLGIAQVQVVGHSMGGMLAVRFALMYPTLVEGLVLENPIGLEDYRSFVPWRSPDQQFAQELNASYESLKQYQQGYYPAWKEEYEPYVAAQWEALQQPDFATATWASALTYNMIYEQPVVYELGNLKVPTLLIIGQADRTVLGKALLPESERGKWGRYPELGKAARSRIRGSKLVALEGVGHIPHLQVPDLFRAALLGFLK